MVFGAVEHNCGRGDLILFSPNQKLEMVFTLQHMTSSIWLVTFEFRGRKLSVANSGENWQHLHVQR
jgi:hypothetical protein